MKTRLPFNALVVLSCGLAALGPAPWATPHARTHSWFQEHGNLVPNWSFENELDTWSKAEAYGGMAADPRHAPSAFPPRSGSFVGRIHGATTTSGAVTLLRSQKFEVVPGQAYTLSFYVRSSGTITGSGRPAIFLHPHNAGHVAYLPGPTYATFSGSAAIPDWTLYSLSFVMPADVRFAHVALWRSAAVNAVADLYFDELVLEEGAFDAAAAAARRNRHGYSVAFSDGLGRPHQSHTRLPGGDYRVDAVSYDSAGRPEKIFLPFVAPGDEAGSPEFQADPLSGANAYYYYQTITPGLGGNPYSETRYAPEPTPRAIRTAAPGSAWLMDEGRNVETGFCFVAHPGIPSLPPCASSDPGEKEYRLDWRRDEDSAYALSWTNRKGQVVQTATQAEGSSWAITKTDYYPNGLVRRIRTPLDTSGAAFAEVFNHDAAGQLTSRFDPDRGLVKFWYNKRGLPRYSQTEVQRAKSPQLFGYIDYDDAGNVVSMGEQMLYYPVPNQEVWVDGNGEGYPYDKIEHKGWLYGDLQDFGTRTGLSLDSVPGASVIDGAFRAGALRATWHRNPGSLAPRLSATERLVVDFHDYDHRGNIQRRHKYVGAMENSLLHTVEYAYDATDRPTLRKSFPADAPHEPLMVQAYSYDALGRVSAITGLDDTVARYGYFRHGALREVGLGGDSAGAGVWVGYGYHPRSWIREIKAFRDSDGHAIWRQSLGYEARAIDEDGAPPPAAPRHTGQITQQVYHYSSDVPNPVRAVNYVYDRMGRLTTADYRHGTGLDAHGELAFPLSLSDASDLDTRVAYDLNGRILGKRSGGVMPYDSASYHYRNDSYRLERVTGKLSGGNRDASHSQNFAYDADGRMTRDLSKNLRIAYAYDGMPVEMAIRDDDREIVLFPLYDAAGQRVTQVTARRLPRGFPVYWVGRREGGEPEGIYDAPTIEAALADAHHRLNSLNQPAPDSLVLYVVPDSGSNAVLPEGGEINPASKGDTIIPVILRGVLKHGAVSPGLLGGVGGTPLAIRHWVNQAGILTHEVAESFDSTGVSVDRRVVVNIHGRGMPVGRVVETDTGPVAQFFIKNHLGSTVRVVNADGSYATTPVFDYQAYGELQAIREDSLNPVTQKFTGKEWDSVLALYYFGARWYDPELSMWLTSDPMNEYMNLYSYVGYSPLMGIDPNGMLCFDVWNKSCRRENSRQVWNATTDSWEFVKDHKQEFILGAVIVATIATGGSGALIGVGYGAAIGAGSGIAVEGLNQAIRGDFNLGNLASAGLSGALVGGASGGLLGAAGGGASFFGSATPGLGGVTNGALMGTFTAVGGGVGGVVGAAQGNTAGGITTGGYAGVMASAAVVGAAYSVQGYNSFADWTAQTLDLKMKFSLFGVSVPGVALAGAVGSVPAIEGYRTARGERGFNSDIRFMTRMFNRTKGHRDALSLCVSTDGGFVRDPVTGELFVDPSRAGNFQFEENGRGCREALNEM